MRALRAKPGRAASASPVMRTAWRSVAATATATATAVALTLMLALALSASLANADALELTSETDLAASLSASVSERFEARAHAQAGAYTSAALKVGSARAEDQVGDVDHFRHTMRMSNVLQASASIEFDVFETVLSTEPNNNGAIIGLRFAWDGRGPASADPSRTPGYDGEIDCWYRIDKQTGVDPANDVQCATHDKMIFLMAEWHAALAATNFAGAFGAKARRKGWARARRGGNRGTSTKWNDISVEQYQDVATGLFMVLEFSVSNYTVAQVLPSGEREKDAECMSKNSTETCVTTDSISCVWIEKPGVCVSSGSSVMVDASDSGEMRKAFDRSGRLVEANYKLHSEMGDVRASIRRLKDSDGNKLDISPEDAADLLASISAAAHPIDLSNLVGTDMSRDLENQLFGAETLKKPRGGKRKPHGPQATMADMIKSRLRGDAAAGVDVDAGASSAQSTAVEVQLEATSLASGSCQGVQTGWMRCSYEIGRASILDSDLVAQATADIQQYVEGSTTKAKITFKVVVAYRGVSASFVKEFDYITGSKTVLLEGSPGLPGLTYPFGPATLQFSISFPYTLYLEPGNCNALTICLRYGPRAVLGITFSGSVGVDLVVARARAAVEVTGNYLDVAVPLEVAFDTSRMCLNAYFVNYGASMFVQLVARASYPKCSVSVRGVKCRTAYIEKVWWGPQTLQAAGPGGTSALTSGYCMSRPSSPSPPQTQPPPQPPQPPPSSDVGVRNGGCGTVAKYDMFGQYVAQYRSTAQAAHQLCFKKGFGSGFDEAERGPNVFGFTCLARENVQYWVWSGQPQDFIVFRDASSRGFCAGFVNGDGDASATWTTYVRYTADCAVQIATRSELNDVLPGGGGGAEAWRITVASHRVAARRGYFSGKWNGEQGPNDIQVNLFGKC